MRPKRTHHVQHAPTRDPAVLKKDPLDPGMRLRVIVILRKARRHPAHPAVRAQQALAATPAQHRRKMTHHEVAQVHMCDPADLARVISYACDHDLAVVRFEPACRHLVLEGRAANLNEAFGVNLHWFDHGDQVVHGHHEPVRLPEAVAPLVEHVLGLDHSPFRRPGSLRPEPTLARTRARKTARKAAKPAKPITPAALIEHYAYPRRALGKGQRIAIIALGGGYHASDLQSYFSDVLGLAHTPVVRSISVDGAKNEPLAMDKLTAVMTAYNDPNNSLADLRKQFPDDLGPAIATVETTMDVQLAVAAAPEAEIDVYYAPGSPMGMYDVIHAICGLHEATDEAGAPYAPGPPPVISMSWAQPEGQLAQSAASMDAAIERAQCLGVCMVCCSGDAGSYGFKDPKDGSRIASVMYPASSRSVLAVGGTQFATGAPDAATERVWNDDNRGSPQASGGGVSGGFPMPWWQRGRGVPTHGALNGPAWIHQPTPKAEADGFVGRGVPDVAAYANQMPGYAIRVGGVDIGSGGTSASTPMWAGLVTRLCDATGEALPWLAEMFYHPAFATAFRNITDGDNAIEGYDVASFSARGAKVHGWSACAGLGVPHGDALLRVLREAKRAAG